MPRTDASLPGGVRLSDVLSVTLLAASYPVERVRQVLADTGRESKRERALPATVMVYYVMALAVYMQVSYEEILHLVVDTFNGLRRRRSLIKVPAKSSIAEARERLGPDPVRLLSEQMVHPIATQKTRGAFYRGWRLVSLDGSTLDVGDTDANVSEIGRPGVSRGGGSAFPKLRFCTLLENGTHVLFGAEPGPYATGETTLARRVVNRLASGMLCLADRNFYGYQLWTRAARTGADLLWRVKGDALLPCEKRLPDGSYLSTIYASAKNRRSRTDGTPVRVIEFRLTGEGAPNDTLYRLITTIVDHRAAPALELAAVYSDRWEIETALDEFKTHLRGRGIVLRSKTPQGVYQEFWGFVLAHHAIRCIMHDAALKVDLDPDRLSYTHTLHAIRRHMLQLVDTPPSVPHQEVQ